MADIFSSGEGIGCAYLVTDYGETFMTHESGTIGNIDSTQYKYFRPVRLPIKPVCVLERSNVTWYYDQSGHIYGRHDSYNNEEILEIDNLEAPITKVLLAETQSIGVVSNNKTHFYCLDYKGVIKKYTVDFPIKKCSMYTCKYINKWEKTYAGIALINNKLYFGTETASIGYGSNVSTIIAYCPINITSSSTPVLTNVKKYIFTYSGSYPSSDKMTITCATLLILKTDNTLVKYQCENIDVSTHTLSFDDFSIVDSGFENETILDMITYDEYTYNTYKGLRSSTIYWHYSNGHDTAQLRLSDRIIELKDSSGDFRVNATYIISGKEELAVDNYMFDPTNGTIRFLSDPSSDIKNTEYYNSDTRKITFPSKIVAIYDSVIKTQDGKLYHMCNGGSYPYYTLGNSRSYSYFGEITSFQITGAGYLGSQLRETLINFQDCLPTDLKKVITAIPKKTSDIISTVNLSDYSHVLTSNVVETNDKIFTLSEHEVLGTNKSYSFTVNGKTVPQSSDKNYQTQYAYYANGAHSLKRVAHNDPNTEVEWWTRTPYLYTDSQGVQRVFSSSFKTGDKTDATARPNATNQRKSLGIVPCFGIAADIT